MNHREFIKLASKFVREWNGHLEIFSLPQVIENSRQYLLLRTDILQKTVVGCPLVSPLTSPLSPCLASLSNLGQTC